MCSPAAKYFRDELYEILYTLFSVARYSAEAVSRQARVCLVKIAVRFRMVRAMQMMLISKEMPQDGKRLALSHRSLYIQRRAAVTFVP